MQNAPSSSKTYPGATCNQFCPRCSRRNYRSKRQLHVWLPDDQFWECTVCANRIHAFQPADLIEKPDPETEILHAQWREDNEDYPRWTQDHRK